jgi:hypothetical protein
LNSYNFFSFAPQFYTMLPNNTIQQANTLAHLPQAVASVNAGLLGKETLAAKLA